MRMNLDGWWLGLLCEGLEEQVGASPVLRGSHGPCFPGGGQGPGGAGALGGACWALPLRTVYLVSGWEAGLNSQAPQGRGTA